MPSYILSSATLLNFTSINLSDANGPKFQLNWTRFPPAKDGLLYSSIATYLQRSTVASNRPDPSNNSYVVVGRTTPLPDSNWTTIHTWNGNGFPLTYTDTPPAGSAMYAYRLIYFVSQASSGDVYEVDYNPVSWATSQPGKVLLAQNYGGTQSTGAQGVIGDGSGNFVVANFFAGTITVGVSTYTALGSQDLLLIKLDVNGNVVWSKHYGVSGGGFLKIVGVEKDNSGNIYIGGSFTGTTNLGGSDLVGPDPSNYNCFLAKYDSSGNHTWSIGFGGLSTDTLSSFKVFGSNGNIYAGGGSRGGFTVDSAVVPSTGADIGWMAKFSTAGVGQWAKITNVNHPIFANASICGAIALDASENAFMVGYSYPGTLDFSGSNPLVVQNAAVYMAKFDSSGTYQWSQAYGKDNTGTIDTFMDATCDSSGLLWVGAGFQGQMNLGPGNVTSVGFFDVFLGGYSNSNGTFVKGTIAKGSRSNDIIHTICVRCDSSNTPMLMGEFNGTVITGSKSATHTDKPNFHGFIGKYDALFNSVWLNAIANTVKSFTNSGIFAAALYQEKTIAVGYATAAGTLGGVPFGYSGGIGYNVLFADVVT